LNILADILVDTRNMFGVFVQYVVEEMNILTTVFLGDFGAKVCWPNSVLATKPIQNFFRSPEMGDGIEFIVQASTPVEKIAAFKEKIGVYVFNLLPLQFCPVRDRSISQRKLVTEA
jgi:small-conductance mechanosensitive channel